jgi:hypothetical protein
MPSNAFHKSPVLIAREIEPTVEAGKVTVLAGSVTVVEIEVVSVEAGSVVV